MILLLYVMGDGNIAQGKSIFLVYKCLSTTRGQGAGNNKVDRPVCS